MIFRRLFNPVRYVIVMANLCSKIPVYNICGDNMVVYGEDNVGNDEMKMIRAESTDPMLCIVSVKCNDPVQVHDEEAAAVLIDDMRTPSKDDTIIDLDIDGKALHFLSFFLLFTLQRIPRHFSTPLKRLMTIAQLLVVLVLLACYANDLGLFGANTLTTNQLDTVVTSIKNAISNLRFPLLYIVGIFYFRTRHLETLLAGVRLTKRYWKHGRRSIIITIVVLSIFTVCIPVICKSFQMSAPTKAQTPAVSYNLRSIILNSIISIVVRSMYLSVIFAFVLSAYLIYCQIRLFKEQIQKWPQELQSHARDALIDIRRKIKEAERFFQPFLIVHLTILLIMLIPMIVSCIEQFETEGRYRVTLGVKMDPANLEKKLESLPVRLVIIKDINNATFLVRARNGNRIHYGLLEPTMAIRKATESPMEKYIEGSTENSEEKIDPLAIIKIILSNLVEFLEMMMLYSLPIVLIGKIDKCIKAIRDDVEMLKFGEQRNGNYIFQEREDVDAWVTELEGARSIQLFGMNLASLKAALLTLLLPFVTTMFRLMIRQVHINP